MVSLLLILLLIVLLFLFLLNKGKSILGAPPKQDKKKAKNPRTKKDNFQKPKQKKQHLYHHCGVAGHTRPNCYK